MPGVHLTLEMPDHSWIQTVSTAYPEVEFRVLTILINQGIGHAVLEVKMDQPGDLLGRLQAEEDLRQVDLISVGSGRAIFQIETEETSILTPLTSAGVPLETPIHISDGTATWKFITSHERLADLSSQLEESGMTYRVERVSGEETPPIPDGPALTDRQSNVFSKAHQMGYFEIPRTATVEDVARETGVSKSTASDILRRAMRNLVEWYMPQQ